MINEIFPGDLLTASDDYVKRFTLAAILFIIACDDRKSNYKFYVILPNHIGWYGNWIQNVYEKVDA